MFPRLAVVSMSIAAVTFNISKINQQMLIGVTDVLNREQLVEIHSLLEKAEYVDGKTTAGYRASRVKSNLQMKRGSEQSNQLRDIVVNSLTSNNAFRDVTFPKAINTPMFSRYLPGMEYGFHVDSAVMNQPYSLRTDISVTVFLNEPSDYDGGELVVQTPFGEHQVKLKAGDAVVYTSEFLHRVAPVTRGERLCAVTWVQSFVREPERRQILIDVAKMQKTMHKHAPDDQGTDLAYKVHQNLYRMWADV